MKKKFNLSKILFSINNKLAILTDDVVELYLNEENLLNLKMGEITYRINSARLQSVLDDKNYDDKNEDFINEVLSKHLVNKLMTLLGKKAYSQIRTKDFNLE